MVRNLQRSLFLPIYYHISFGHIFVLSAFHKNTAQYAICYSFPVLEYKSWTNLGAVGIDHLHTAFWMNGNLLFMCMFKATNQFLHTSDM